ncbi:MAG: hypothetical protein IAE79_16635 [Anaerolinea sp.]|nr:hypothetical protein [Anaerolinea sp.]
MPPGLPVIGAGIGSETAVSHPPPHLIRRIKGLKFRRDDGPATASRAKDV